VLYLRDHIVRQFEIAADTDDPAERAARCTFVAGAGQTDRGRAGGSADRHPAPPTPSCATRPCAGCCSAPPSAPLELDARLSATADRVLRERGVDVRMGVSVDEADHDGVRLTTGDEVATRTLVWCVGVRADPLVESVGLKTEKGRVVVDEFMRVPGHPEVFACGDAAAVPDATRPGQATAMTAQHAQRQGKLVARNVAASLGRGTGRRYKHHDLGFVVELGGRRRGRRCTCRSRA
jgi:NADH dehydrogenase